MATQKATGKTTESMTGHDIVDQIVAMLGRSPAWPELRPGGRLP